MNSLMKPVLLAAMVLLLLSGCSAKEQEHNADGKLKVYTTIFPLEDFAKKIGGNKVEVESVLPPNVEAHSYEPSAKTMVNMAGSDAFIYTGAGVEGFGDKAAETLKHENVAIVKAAEGIKLLKGEHHHDEDTEHKGPYAEEEEAHGDTDPHLWLDPLRAIQIADNIKKSLISLRPEHKQEFEQNFQKLKTDLTKLDQDFAQTIKQSPKKEILVSHAAYGYWESRYGVHEISVMGLSPMEEPSQKTLESVVKEAKAHSIRYVIFESNISSKISEIVEKEIGAKPLTLYNLESVPLEAVKNNKDYISLMRENLKTLKTALAE
ncbi:metal ABC transporter solute-binding protein, Zn/Mn family [Metabacillus kandeliae]|uniref:metal ABC transporter solute-binding protein, Zn/Mn family n=1 Tax=Metabacillus kandeliae TaxID=2900151 RepID=UPI0038CC1B8B